MKTNIKVIASLLICGLMLLAGCTTPDHSLPGELAGQNIESPDTFNLLAPYFFLSQDEDADTLKQQWIDEMSKRYDVNINIVSDSYKDGKRVNDAINQLYNTLYGRATFEGMAFVSSYDLLSRAIQNGTAVPLEDYLADNPVWKAFPEELKSAFMVDGHVYAIPTSCNWNMYARSIYADTLEQTGVEVTDLKSFRDYALALKKSGDFEYIMGSVGPYGLGDIFNAYGSYMAKYSGHPFSYDPAEDCIVDFLTKDSAVTALEYLRDLYAAGVLKMYSENSRGPYQDFTAGTCPTNYDSYTINENYTEVYTLNPAYPQLLDCNMNGYIMTKDTPEPKETVNFFLNMLYGSEQNYFDCYLGLSENYILNSDGTITYKLNATEDGDLDSFPAPGLVGALPGIFPHSDLNFKLEVTGTLKLELAASIELSDQYQVILNDAVRQGSALKIPPFYRQIHTTKLYDKKSDITYLFTNCILDAITDNDYTVQEIVAQYRMDLLYMGGNALLDEMNAAIGKKTAYYYG